jgi:hypothetical protein
MSKGKEQRAESREQRAESREQRAKGRGQRAKSREQRAESREQRAKVRVKIKVHRGNQVNRGSDNMIQLKTTIYDLVQH